MIKKLNHYAIPKNCNGGSPSCPLACIDLASIMPKAWEPRYTEITPDVADLIRDDETGVYTPQGACTDGDYIYRALVADDDQPTKLQKISMFTGEIVKEVLDTSYLHANGMCFAKGFLYIAHSSSTSIVSKVDPNTLQEVEKFNVAGAIWGIAYNPDADLFIVGNVGAAYLSVYYNDFSFMYRIKPQNAFTGAVRQGIHADGNYIYIALDNAYGAVIENEKGSRVMVYTYNGMFIKSIFIPIAEIEWCFEHNGKLWYGTYEGRDENDIKHGKIYATAFDLYPDQTVITGRPTDVSGGMNNLQRLPEGTPVRLWNGSATSGAIVLQSNGSGITVDEDGPFRYLRFRYKGANQQVFDWYPTNNGVVTLREVDITAAVEDSTIRIREMRLTFNAAAQTFTIESNHAEEIAHDASAGTIKISKISENQITEINQIWGVV